MVGSVIVVRLCSLVVDRVSELDVEMMIAAIIG